MEVYYIPNSYSAAVEGAGLNFRFGYTCFGVAPKHSFWCRTTRELPSWYRLLFGWSFGFNYHSGQCDRWYRFRIELGALSIWYLSKGEYADKYTGFHVAWRGLKKWRLLV